MTFLANCNNVIPETVEVDGNVVDTREDIGEQTWRDEESKKSESERVRTKAERR